MLHKALEGAVILETFPKTTVDVFALVLESGGSMSVFLFFFLKFFVLK
jgi:ribonuclease PH